MAAQRSFTPTVESGGFLGQLSTGESAIPRTRRRTASESSRAGKLPMRPYRAKSVSNILDTNDDFHKQFFSKAASPHLHRQSGLSGVFDLADFLRTHPPPPSNFMSIPDDAEDDRSRWAMWKKIGKRSKSAPREPPQIRLPDSAVSGRTTGGHRYIAISIPLEGSPFGMTPRSQYPVIPSQQSRPETGRPGYVRTVKDEKGTVTVLRPVKEDREGSSADDGRSRSASGLRPTTGASFRSASAGRYGNTGRLGGNRSGPPSRGSESILSTEEDRNTARRSASVLRTQTLGGGRPCPARVSSSGGRSLTHSNSIDGLLKQYDAKQSEKHAGSQHRSTSTGPAQPSVMDQFVRPGSRSGGKKAAPIKVINPRNSRGEIINDVSGAIVLEDNPLAMGHGELPHAPSSPSSPASRKEKVRDRKRRDLEAMRSAKEKQEVSKATLSPVRVVVSFEPDPLPSPESTATRKERRLSDDSGSEYLDAPSHQAKRPASLPRLSKSSNHLTARASDQDSSLARHNSLDRTALSRRREWRATREQERQSDETRAAVRQRAKELVAENEEVAAASSTDREILRLYEAYRDHRVREMERRVRRLERHGDVWLRALVPVLDNLNRTMASSSPSPHRDSVSDDEDAGQREYMHSRRPMKRAASSHRTLREAELGRKIDEMESGGRDGHCSNGCCGAHSSEETRGSDTMEPMMRDLAGAAKLRALKSAQAQSQGRSKSRMVHA